MTTYRAAARPDNEEARLRALASYEVLDTLPELAFDEIIELASVLCGVPIAMMSLVDDERQWFKSKVGIDEDETTREVAFCAHAILQDDLFVVPDAKLDERFEHNPMVTSGNRVRFYAGMPLRTPDGLSLGTLCVVDRTPRELTPLQQQALRVLAKQVEAQLELRRVARECARREALAIEQRDAIAELRRRSKELSAMIVHDLKGPLQNVLLNATFVASSESISEDERAAANDVVNDVEEMAGLISNLLSVARADDAGLKPKLEVVELASLFAEIRQATLRRATSLRRRVTANVLSGISTHADRSLLRRVLDNLIENSFKYGGHDIQIEGVETPEWIELIVRDDGPGVPESMREKIFDRYARIESRSDEHASSSSGIGLTFCRMAIEAHGGNIGVEDNDPRGAAFRIRLPK